VGRAIDYMRALRVPNAADIAKRLEAIERDAPLGECLGYGKAAGPRPNDAVTLQIPNLSTNLLGAIPGPLRPN
jgi:hypothetical protein